MSGLVRGIKKVFKKAVKVAKEVAPYAALAAAIYFTGGLAAGAFSGAAGGGAAAGWASLFSGGATAAAGAGSLTWAGAAKTLALNVVSSTLGGKPSLIPPPGGGGGGGSNNMTNKLLWASMGLNVLGQLIAPSSGDIARDQAREMKRFRGSFYGTDENDKPPGPMPWDQAAASTPQQPAPQLTAPAQPARPAGRDLFAEVQAPPQGTSMIGQENPVDALGTRQMQKRDLFGYA